MVLWDIFNGWDGYNLSVVRAIAPLTPDDLAWRPAGGMRSVGETAAHIALGRIDWFHRMGAPGSAELLHALEELPGTGFGPWEAAVATRAEDITYWLERSWEMVAANLRQWTPDDLAFTFEQPYGGVVYAVSRQWVLWRILSHDMHHGGQITVLLGQRGITPPDLGYLGGHITEPPRAMGR